jgi:hypothetical protein
MGKGERERVLGRRIGSKRGNGRSMDKAGGKEESVIKKNKSKREKKKRERDRERERVR